MATGNLLSDRPPFFDGTDTDYILWKARMRVFIQALDYKLWHIIVDGLPFNVVNGKKSEKEEGEEEEEDDEGEDEEDEKLLQLNAKAMHILYSGLDQNVLARVVTSETAMGVWSKLELIYEGTEEVKRMKARIFLRDYELFKMKEEESVIEMFSRFAGITNHLKCFGTELTDSELVRKLLRVLPEKWDAAVATIEMGSDVNKMTVAQLHGKLLGFELQMKKKNKPEENNKIVVEYKENNKIVVEYE